MELLYVWIRKYHNIHNQEFNFSKKYICELDKEKNINIDIKQDAIPEDFFKINSNSYSQQFGQIINITGIVGENGTGKSSILDYIIERINCFVSGEFDKFEKDEQILAIFKEENTLYIYVNSIIINQITIKDSSLNYKIMDTSINPNSSNYKIVYYSNIFDAKKDFRTNSNIIDISTNHLLKRDENYRLGEIQRQLNLIANNIKIKIPIKYPDFLNCSFSSFFYLSEIEQPENAYDLEDIAFQVFSNYFNTGIWKREDWNSGAGFDMYNTETYTVINCVYKECNSEDRNIGQKYRELYDKVKNDIRKCKKGKSELYGNISYIRESKIHSNLDNIMEYCIATNLPDDYMEVLTLKEKVEKEFDNQVKINVYFWDKMVELIESIPTVRQAYFKYKNIKEKIKIDMLEYIPADKELQEFRRRAVAELASATPYEQLKIRVCLSYFFVFYRTNHKEEIFRYNWEEPFMRDLLEGKLGTVASIINFFVAYEGSNDYWKSRLGNFIECLDKFVEQKVVIINENGKGFKIMIQKENILSYRELILGAYNESQEVFTQNFDFLDLDWYDMSSGEKAMLNLLSRFYSARELIGTVEHLLILIDEGETYFHPEWQREYIYLLLEALSTVFPENNIQVIFTSNSPLVISDLPRENIVFLESVKGLCCVRKNSAFRETFGANIHTLLSDSFFMKNDLIGKFAREKIDYSIGLLNSNDESFKRDVRRNKIDLKKLKKEISVIGEELIRNKLLDMYTRKVGRLGLNEGVVKVKSNEAIDFQQMTNEDLQSFKKHIENVIREREFNDKSNN